MGLRSWLGFGAGLQTRDEEGGPDEPSPASPSQIAPPSRNPESTNPLSLSMVYRAIVIHEIAVKQLSIQRWKENVTDPEGQDQRLLPGSFLRKPDIETTRQAFLGQTVVSLAARGNCYWLKRTDDYGRIRNASVLNPLQMHVTRDPDSGQVLYWYAGRRQPYLANEIQHLKLLRVPGTEYGLGPIQAAAVELAGALDLRDYSSNWFRDSGVPTSGVLTTEQSLSPAAAEAAKKIWHETSGGIRVLGHGLTYSPYYLSPAEAQFLESMQFTTTQIARLFGSPASLMLAVVEGNSQTYANVEQDWLGFVRFSNMQYLLEIEDALSQMLPTFEYAKFNIEALLRTDTTTRYTAFKTGIEAGWLLKSEVRKIENMKPIPGIDDKPATPAAPAPAQENEDA